MFVVLAATAVPAAANPANEAAAISHVAHGKATAGKWIAAAELYMQAYRTDPSVVGYLRSGATSLFKADSWKAAIDAYELLLQKLPEHDEARVKVRERLATCRQRMRKDTERANAERLKAETKLAADEAKIDKIKRENEVLKAASAKSVKEAQKHKANADGHRQNAAKSRALYTWLLAGAGVVAVGAGGFLTFDGKQLGSELETDLQKRDAKGKVVGLDHDEAVSRQDGANMRIGVGAGLAAVGVAACATAVWRHLNAPKVVAQRQWQLAPTFGGASLMVQF